MSAISMESLTFKDFVSKGQFEVYKSTLPTSISVGVVFCVCVSCTCREVRGESEKNQKIHDFRPKKREGHFLTPPPPPTPLKTSKKWVSSGGG